MATKHCKHTYNVQVKSTKGDMETTCILSGFLDQLNSEACMGASRCLRGRLRLAGWQYAHMLAGELNRL